MNTVLLVEEYDNDISLEDLSKNLDALISWFTTIGFPDGLRKNPHYYGHLKISSTKIRSHTKYVYKRILSSDAKSFMFDEIPTPEALSTTITNGLKSLENKIPLLHEAVGLVSDAETAVIRESTRPGKFDTYTFVSNITMEMEKTATGIEKIGLIMDGKRKRDHRTISEAYGSKREIYDAITINNRMYDKDPIKVLYKLSNIFNELSVSINTLLKRSDVDASLLSKIKENIHMAIKLGQATGLYIDILMSIVKSHVATMEHLYEVI